MTVAPSIDPARFLEEHLAQASPDLLRDMLSTFIHTLLSADADAVCGAAYGTVSDDRTNRRNGYRHRDFDTRAGTVDVQIPKLRQGTYFPDWLLERRRRAERALTTVVATCYLLGVSTRRMEKLVDSLGITSLSKSQVSVMARDLDEHVAEFRSRPLDAGPYTFVACDALTMKVREGGRVVNVAVLVATGVNGDGHREILGLQVATTEDGAGWLTFFRDLTARGLTGVKLVTSKRPRRPGCCDRGNPARSGLATLPHPLRGKLDEHRPEEFLAVGENTSALRLRPARYRLGARPVRPGPRRAGTQTAESVRPPRCCPRRHPRLHRLPEGALAADLVEQPERATQPGDPPSHGRCWDLP